jgi:outer membrane receptor protein involved in Fe transport
MNKTKKLLTIAIKAGTAFSSVAFLTTLHAQDDAIAEGRIPVMGGDITEIVTLGQYVPDEKRATASISNVLDSEMFARAGDSNVADGLKRVSGINLEGGKFVFIRGLGERYSSSVLNGSILPSPEPINRVVPLDMFPQGIIESVLVQKTYSAKYSAEFAAGAVEMRTKVVPDESFIKLTSGFGYSGNTTWDDGFVYNRGGTDWLGKDDGTRAIPELLKQATAGDKELKVNNFFYKDGVSKEELELIGESLPGNYTTSLEKIKPDLSLGTTFGLVKYIGDQKIGLLGNLSIGNSWDTKTISRNSWGPGAFEGELVPRDQFEFMSTTRDVNASGFLTAGWEIDQDNNLKATVLQLVKSYDMAGVETGLLQSEGVDVKRTRLEFVEQGLLSMQIDGEHYFDSSLQPRLNWHYTEATAKRDAPDTRDYRYDWDASRQAYRFSQRQDANRRLWAELEDNVTDYGVNVELYFNTPFDTYTTLNFGGSRVERARDSSVRSFNFVPNGKILAANAEIFFRPTLEEIFTQETISPDGFFLRETTQATDNYFADQVVDALYLEVDVEVSPSVRLMAGVRSEASDQNVTTFNLFNKNQTVNSNNSSDQLYPVVTATYIIEDYDMQVRASYSETTSRPDFRELSPAVFIHPETGIFIIGNPELENTFVKNYDIRWEWYFSADENISIGGFYKQFDKPIEMIILPSSTGIRSYTNAEAAETYGIEIDGFRWLDFISDKLEGFYVSANLSLIESSINIDPLQAGVLTNTNRRLQGQADFIWNVQLGYDNEYNQRASLVYHITGEKIREVGILGAPDVLDQPYGELDFIFTRLFNKGQWEFEFKGKNLLNMKRETLQGNGFDVNSWHNGTSASVGIKYNFL